MKKQEQASARELFDRIKGSHAPGMDAADVDRIIRGHFSGRRAAIRTYRALDCVAHGGHGPFRALALDASRSGVLLRVTDPNFALASDMDDLMSYAARVSFHFGEEFQLAFLEGELFLPAVVVRITGHAGVGNASGIILLGCRFARDLTQAECGLLGIECGEDRPPGSDLA